jgi:hypothetical protein
MSAGWQRSELEMPITSQDVPHSSIKTLGALRKAEAACTRCPLYQFATQVVPGEGPAHAPMDEPASAAGARPHSRFRGRVLAFET